MLEKNGMLTLTQEEWNLYKQGQVPERIKEDWELDLDSLDGMIKSGSYEIVNDNSTSGEKQ